MENESSEDKGGKKGWPSAVADGLVAAWPICLGYFPAGAAIGVLAQKVGLHPLDIGLMSLMVFAGSGQFIAVSMIGAGATVISVIVTTFIVNLRHLLMSSSLSVHLKGIGNGWLLLYGYGITDETFAVNLNRFRDGDWDWRRALVVNLTAASAWIGSNIAGCYGAQFIPPRAFGIDYAMTGMFICLLVLQLRGAIYIAVAVLAGVLAVAVAMHLPGNAYIVIASVAAATAGVVIRKIPFFATRDGDGP